MVGKKKDDDHNLLTQRMESEENYICELGKKVSVARAPKRVIIA